MATEDDPKRSGLLRGLMDSGSSMMGKAMDKGTDVAMAMMTHLSGLIGKLSDDIGLMADRTAKPARCPLQRHRRGLCAAQDRRRACRRHRDRSRYPKRVAQGGDLGTEPVRCDPRALHRAGLCCGLDSRGRLPPLSHAITP